MTVTPVDLRVRYPRGPTDAETLIWTPDGRLLIVTKEIFGGDVLEVPPAAVRTALGGHSVEIPALARKVGHVSQGLPTDGVALPGRPAGDPGLRAGRRSTRPRRTTATPLVAQTRLTWPAQDQGETIAAIDGGRAVVVGSEGKDEALLRVDVPASAGGTGIGTTSASAGGAAGSSAAGGGPGHDSGRAVGYGLFGLAALMVARTPRGYGSRSGRGARRRSRCSG